MKRLDDLTFNTMLNVLQSGIWLLNDFETYLRPFNMSQARFAILLTLQHSETGEINPNEMAKITGKSKAGIARIIQKLSEDNLIVTSKDSCDGRGKKISLTSKGSALLKDIIPDYNQRISDMGSNLSPDEKKTLNNLLNKINFLDKEKKLWSF